MARIETGWVKSFREDFFTLKHDANLWLVYSAVNNLSNYERGDKLEIGEMLTGSAELSNLLRISRKVVKSKLAKLVSLGMISKRRYGARNSQEGLVIKLTPRDDKKEVKNETTPLTTLGTTEGITLPLSHKGFIDFVNHAVDHTRTTEGPHNKNLRIKEEKKRETNKPYSMAMSDSESPSAESLSLFLNQSESEIGNQELKPSQERKNIPPIDVHTQSGGTNPIEKEDRLNPPASDWKVSEGNNTDLYPPEAVQICSEWRKLFVRFNPYAPYNVQSAMKAIREMAAIVGYQKLAEIVQWLASISSDDKGGFKLASEFASPHCYSRSFFGTGTLLDAAVRKMAETKSSSSKKPPTRAEIEAKEAFQKFREERRSELLSEAMTQAIRTSPPGVMIDISASQLSKIKAQLKIDCEAFVSAQTFKNYG